jgi:hypothetical protein
MSIAITLDLRLRPLLVVTPPSSWPPCLFNDLLVAFGVVLKAFAFADVVDVSLANTQLC